eukprot:3617798-Rhodomonas_salina.1
MSYRPTGIKPAEIADGIAVGDSVGCSRRSSATAKIKHKKPHFQYKFYQQCGFLELGLQCIFLRAPYAMPGTDLAEAAAWYKMRCRISAAQRILYCTRTWCYGSVCNELRYLLRRRRRNQRGASYTTTVSYTHLTLPTICSV